MHSPLGCWAGLIVCVWAASSVVRAEEPASKLIVLVDGRTMSGQVVRHAAGYLIEKPSGRVVVPAEQVRCVADNLVQAYRMQREQMTDPTAADLIQLAEWGISYKLYDESRDDLKRALKRAPESEPARRLLARLDDTLDPPHGRAPAAPSRLAPDGFLVQDIEALGGLNRSTAAAFTSRIQPLLMNKCARCHHSSEREFQLAPVRLDNNNHRRAAERNMAQVLRYITPTDPLRSPLLTLPQGAHGGSTTALFGGASGADQYKLLKDWVKTVAQELRTQQAELAASAPKSGKKPPAVVAAEAPRTESAALTHNPRETDGVTPAAFAQPADSDERSTAESGRKLPDAFAPEVFNRLPVPRARTRPH